MYQGFNNFVRFFLHNLIISIIIIRKSNKLEAVILFPFTLLTLHLFKYALLMANFEHFDKTLANFGKTSKHFDKTFTDQTDFGKT